MSDPVVRLNAALEGHYAIERELGEGGMATVYLADDLKHERKVALKVLKPESRSPTYSALIYYVIRRSQSEPALTHLPRTLTLYRRKIE